MTSGRRAPFADLHQPAEIRMTRIKMRYSAIKIFILFLTIFNGTAILSALIFRRIFLRLFGHSILLLFVLSKKKD